MLPAHKRALHGAAAVRPRHAHRLRARPQAMELYQTALELDGENKTYKGKYDQICMEWESDWAR